MVQVLGVEVQPTVTKEPVLDVPAIDMTDAGKPEVPSRMVPGPNQARGAKAPTPKRSARRATVTRPDRPVLSKNPSAGPPPSRKVEGDQPKRTRDGSVGRDTFQQVEALLKQGKNKTEAFKQVAADTGKNRGTVAANYYRLARANGAVRQPQTVRAKPGPTTAKRSRQSNSRSGNDRSLDQIVGQVVAAVQALTEAVKAQDAEVRELRGRLERARRLLG
jgi:hypothetical protein